MTEPIENPFVLSASALGEVDDRLFEKMFDELYRNDLRNATPQELAFALGVATGTILNLRRQIARLERPDEQ
jgi:hypothetical protein